MLRRRLCGGGAAVVPGSAVAPSPPPGAHAHAIRQARTSTTSRASLLRRREVVPGVHGVPGGRLGHGGDHLMPLAGPAMTRSVECVGAEDGILGTARKIAHVSGDSLPVHGTETLVTGGRRRRPPSRAVSTTCRPRRVASGGIWEWSGSARP